MAFSQNRLIIVGHVTEKSELRQTPNGTSVLDLNVQVKSRFTKDDGTNQLGTSFHNITIWSKQAEVADQFLRPGSQVYIAGRLKTEEWDGENGQKKRKTKIIAQELILLDSRTPVTPLDDHSLVGGGINRAELLGNLTRDPELRQTPNGNSVCNFGVATNRRWKANDSTEWQEETEFHNIVVWGDLANETSEKIKKGQKVFVSGRCSTRSWDTPDGEKRRTTEIIADEVVLLGIVDENLAQGQDASSAVKPQTPPAPTENTTPPATESSEPVTQTPVADELPEIPEISHETKIKPEDLPF